MLEQGRGPKVIAFKKRRRKNSRRKRGHRQEFTLVRITEILTDGAKPTKTAARPKPAEAAEAGAERRGEAEAGRRGQGRREARKPSSSAAGKKPQIRHQEVKSGDDFVTKSDYIDRD